MNRSSIEETKALLGRKISGEELSPSEEADLASRLTQHQGANRIYRRLEGTLMLLAIVVLALKVIFHW